jgi:hypothetical protein
MLVTVQNVKWAKWGLYNTQYVCWRIDTHSVYIHTDGEVSAQIIKTLFSVTYCNVSVCVCVCALRTTQWALYP